MGHMGNCIKNDIEVDKNFYTDETQHFKSDDSWIEGEWMSKKDGCSFGYNGVWEITVNRDEVIIEERHTGLQADRAHCCFRPTAVTSHHRWVLHPHPSHMKVSRQTLTKVASHWEGRFLCQTLVLTIVSQNAGFPRGELHPHPLACPLIACMLTPHC